ncbi:HEPN family nuclease [Bacteroides neonati]|uniref:HEPN family nuclease n=1 Tax=Bacteroides neonati TaxID=1347393 RepID=UPI001CA33066|nr:HEPN family nuclease [Bacteroides neonati]
MSSYNAETDFITRTKNILEQYDQNNSTRQPGEIYDVTLLLNCLIGLVVIPRERYTDKVPEINVDGDWGIAEHIELIKGRKTLKKTVKHIRNSVAHGNVNPISEDGVSITHVKFKDCIPCRNCGGEVTFEAKIPVKALRVFTVKFADIMLDIINIPH